MLRRDTLAPLAVLTIWTLAIAFACMQLVDIQRSATREQLLQEARALFEQIVLSQIWNAEHGGVFVRTATAICPSTPASPPPLVLADGQTLHRIDPACMARQFAALAQAQGNHHSFRMVGLPDDAVDESRGDSPSGWETESLRMFLAGATERWTEAADADGGMNATFQYMAPLVGQPSCGRCHAEHRCEPGAICGGIAITLAADAAQGGTLAAIAGVQRWFVAVWAVGGAGLVAGVWLLVRSRRAALEAGRAKSDFLAAMSHELRTPLNGILGLTDLALAEALSDQQREYLLTSRQSAERLHRLFTFMLEYARLDTRERKTRLGEPFALDDCLQVLRHDLKARALEKGLAFRMVVAPDVPPVLTGDMNMLVVALSQLLDNAVKFTESGAVELRVAVRPCRFPLLQRLAKGNQALRCLAFTVVDTGPGISKELVGKLFEPFFQGDASFSRRHAGVGLGLALARRLAQAMGGKVVLTSEPGQGTTVQLTAQFALPE
ncbi:ATP-binding protein [Megalodesulfovibrio gigas]|nr:ATP-binding protein [Megalodesulfovibrio gigas]